MPYLRVKGFWSTFLHQPKPNLDLDRETKVKSEQFFMDMQI